MGWFSSSTNDPIQEYTCISCNSKIKGNCTDKRKNGIMKESNLYLCPTCYKSKSLDHYDIDDLNKEQLLALYKKKGFVSPFEFTPTKRVHRTALTYTNMVYLELDEHQRKINIPELDAGIFNDSISDHIYDYSDIVDFKVIENGSEKLEGNSLLKAAIGGAVFGGTGAIVGALHGSKKTIEKCDELSIKIILKNMSNPNIYIKFIGSNSGIPFGREKDTGLYKDTVKALEECISILTLILRENTDPTFRSSTIKTHSNSKPSKRDKIAKAMQELVALKREGIITEAEFLEKKAQIIPPKSQEVSKSPLPKKEQELLSKLESLKVSGILTNEEFQEKKQALLEKFMQKNKLY